MSNTEVQPTVSDSNGSAAPGVIEAEAQKPAEGKKKKSESPFPKVFGGAQAMPPELVVLIGRDTTHKEDESPYWDRRVFNDPDEGEIIGAMTTGAHMPAINVEFMSTDSLMKFLTPPFLQEARKAWAVFGGGKDFPSELPVVTTGGRQRTLALRAANQRFVKLGAPTMCLRGNAHKPLENEVGFGLRIAENAFHKGLSPIEKALEMKKYEGLYGASDEATMAYFRITRAQKKLLSDLLNLSPKVTKALLAKQITANQAHKRGWCMLPFEEQDALFEKYCVDRLGKGAESDDEETDEETDEGGESSGGGEGEGTGEGGAAPDTSILSPKGFAPARAIVKKLYMLGIEEKLPSLPKEMAAILGVVSGEVEPSAWPGFFNKAIKEMNSIEAKAAKAKETAKLKKEAEKEKKKNGPKGKPGRKKAS